MELVVENETDCPVKPNADNFDDLYGDHVEIPDAVLNYVPPDNVRSAVLKGGYRVRYIFSKVQLTDFELEHIRAFKVYAIQRLEGPNLDADQVEESFKRRFGDTVFGNDAYLLRYIIGNYYSYPQAFVDIGEHLRWRNSTLPIRRADVEGILARGVIYVHGRDKCMRPIIVLRVENAVQFKHEAVLKAIFFTLEFAIAKLMVLGKVEQWRVILDLAGVRVYNMPVTLLKQIAKGLTVNYRGRLAQMFVVNAPYLVTGIWNVVKTVLPPSTQDKIFISSGRNTHKLLQAVAPSQFEVRFGGKAPNATQFDFPILPKF